MLAGTSKKTTAILITVAPLITGDSFRRRPVLTPAIVYAAGMLVLGVLLLAWALFRAAGRMGVGALNNWRASGRWALAVMLLFTASAHFTEMRHDLARMVPEWMPQPLTVIHITGVFEVVGAIGLLIPQTRRLAGVCLCIFFIAVFPANLKAAHEDLVVGGQRATNLLLRIPMQVLFIWLAWWSSREPALPGGSPKPTTV